VAAYCETDVVSTYRVWLVYELFRGRLSRAEFEASEENLLGFLQERVGSKPHLKHLLSCSSWNLIGQLASGGWSVSPV
jgi:3'-5' exonuclease